MRFAQDFIEKVRDANNIVDFLSEYTAFKRTGNQHMGRCPLPGHNEKTPSFSVSENKQVYHCFGCQKSGNIFDAVRELKGLSFPEALEFLAGRAGIAIPENDKTSRAEKASQDNKKLMYKLNKMAAVYFYKNLKALADKHPVKKYCAQRGLSAELIELFHLGFADDHWQGLVHYLEQVKAPKALARKLGLIRPRKEGNGDYDLFRNRLIFPIQDHRGEFVGFGGRALSPEQQPKYLNSVESDVFHKGSTFYGLHESAVHIRQKDAVVIVEGYMDFLALYGAGIKNVVATLGTALTKEHAKLLKRYTRNIVVLFDGDEAGARAAERSLPILLQEGLVPKGVILPDELDPDEFIVQKGVETLRNILVTAPELFKIQLEREIKNFSGSSSEKLTVMDKLSPLLNKISDQRLKDLYMDEVARLLGTDLSWVEKAAKQDALKIKLMEPKAESVTQAKDQGVITLGTRIKVAKAPKAEIFLINLALLSPERLNLIWESEIVTELSHPGIQELLVKAHDFYGQNPNQFDKLTAYLMTLTETPNEVALHLSQQFQKMGPEELNRMQADCVKQIRERYLKNQAREITARMRNQPAPEQLKELERLMNVQKAKRTLKSKTGIQET